MGHRQLFPHTRSKPELGRLLDANDDQPGHEFVAVVSHRFGTRILIPRQHKSS